MMSELTRKKFSYGLTKQKKKEIMSWRDITRKSLATSGIWDSEKTSPFKSVHLQESSVQFDNDPFAYDEDDDFSIKDTKKGTPKKATQKKATLKKVTPKKVSSKKEYKENFTNKKEKSVPRLCEQISGKELPDQPVSITSEEIKSCGSPKKHHRNSCSSNISEVKDNFSLKDDKKLKVPEHQKEQPDKCNVIFINEFDILVVKDSAIKKKQKNPHVTKNHNIKKAKKKKDNQIAMKFVEDVSDDCIDFHVLETESSPCENTAITVDSYDTLELPFEKTVRNIYSSDMFQRTQEDCCKTLTPQESLQKGSTICSLSNSSQEKKIDAKSGKMKSSLFSYYSDLKKDKNKRTNIFSHSNKLHISKDDDEFADCEESHSGTAVQRGVPGAIEVSTSPKMKRQKTDKLESSSSSINENQSESIDKIPGPKSPFKSYKTALQHRIISKRRRFSALPTDITTDSTALEEDIDKEENDDHISHVLLPETTMFNFHRPANNPVRVPRKYKHLYVVVKNTKRAHECFEDGQNQQLEDDVEYLLDGLKPSHTISTRCLSALDLALKSITPGFRMHLKAHGIIPKVFGLLEDALEDEQLALCTATFMYTLAKDRSTIDFNKVNIEFLIKLLSKKTSETNESKTSETNESKDFPRIKNKIQTLLEKLDENNIDKESIDAVSICRETLLLLTSKRIGNWFKDEIRKLGGLDHLTDTIYTFSKCIQKRKEQSKSYHPMDRYLNLLEDVILQSPDNQNYLVSYRDGILLESCIRSINTISHQIDLANDFSIEMQNCLFSTLKIMTDLSHENADGCAIICKEDGSLNCVLRCALHIPQYLPEESKFDFVAVSLGLLINLVEHSQQNVGFLNATFSPACCESQSSEDIDNFTAVEALMQLFLVRIEMCKEGDLMEELDKLEDENREREAALHYEDDEFALICGDRFDDTVLDAEQQEVAQTESNEVDQKEKEAVEKVELSSQETLNASEKQDIKNTLDKAHKHMEDSHVAAYTALLIGLLLENNEVNQQLVHSLLPEGDFKLMQDMLIKILSFMKITNATNERGLKVIERVIEFYDSCSKQFPRRQ